MRTHDGKPDRREHLRHQLALPAAVSILGGVLRGETVNLSPAGVRIRLPLPFDIRMKDAVRAVVIDGVGHFDCRLVWTSGFDLGLNFRDPGRAATLLGPVLSGLG